MYVGIFIKTEICMRTYVHNKKIYYQRDNLMIFEIIFFLWMTEKKLSTCCIKTIKNFI